VGLDLDMCLLLHCSEVIIAVAVMIMVVMLFCVVQQIYIVCRSSNL